MRTTELSLVGFYNRLEGEQVRWVSYHYGGEPECLLSDADVVKCLSSLTP